MTPTWNLDGFAKEEEQLTEPEPRKPEVRLRRASLTALRRHRGGLAQQRQSARPAAAMRGLVEQVEARYNPWRADSLGGLTPEGPTRTPLPPRIPSKADESNSS